MFFYDAILQIEQEEVCVFEAEYETDFLVRLFSSGQKSLFILMSKFCIPDLMKKV